MSEKFRNKFRISSIRLQNWDYGSNAAYFISICSKNKTKYFGTLRDNKMKINEIISIAQEYWEKIPTHFPFVDLDAFVVMPNHVHGILVFHNAEEKCNALDRTFGKTRFGNQGKNTLSSVVGFYKSIVTKNARKIDTRFGWQTGF